MKPGDIVTGDNGRSFQVGELVSVQGAKGCTDPRCRRVMGEDGCRGYHCPKCGAPTSMMGHTCPSPAEVDEVDA